MNDRIHLIERAWSAPVPQLSILIPVFNEESVLEQLATRLLATLNATGLSWEVLFVDDGSSDQSANLLMSLRRHEPRFGIVRLSRNFGKEAAVTCGLQMVRGKAVVLMDADLQDPPELLPQLIATWQQGFDVVNMRRTSRAGESWLKKATAKGFYRAINHLSETAIPRDVGDFRLLSRRAVDALNSLPERNRFMKGLFAWVGFSQTTIDYEREARAAGTSKWPYRRLFGLAVDGITSFSVAPLRLASVVGLLSAASAFVYAIQFLAKTALFGDPVPGFPTLIVCVLLLGGLQLMAIGVVGEYLGRLYIESKGRPIYLVDTHLPSECIELRSDERQSTGTA